MDKDGLNLLFAGTPDFAAAHLSALVASHHRVKAVITQPDKPGKRGKRPLPSPVKTLAESLDLPVIQPPRLDAHDIRPFSPDLLIVVAYGQILRKPVLDLPKLGCINVHASLLPRWRGAAPIQRALLAGDRQTGISIMQMDEGLDTGDVLAQAQLTVATRETTFTLTRRLADLGIETLLGTLVQLQAGRAVARPQSVRGVTYARKLEKSEAEIDWHQTVTRVDRQIRAFNPDPVAFSQLQGLRIKVWQAEILNTDLTAAAGKIIACTGAGVDVACGQGTLRITRLQIPVGKGSLLSAVDLMNARRPEFAPGNIFG